MREVSSSLIVTHVGSIGKKYKIENIRLNYNRSDEYVYIDIEAENIETNIVEFFDKRVCELKFFGTVHYIGFINSAIKELFGDEKFELPQDHESLKNYYKLKDVTIMRIESDYALVRGVDN